MAKCASGEFTDCIDDPEQPTGGPIGWKTVIKDGMWNATLGDSWDVSLVPDSPAIDVGVYQAPRGTSSEGHVLKGRRLILVHMGPMLIWLLSPPASHAGSSSGP